ncbi:MAG TPA: stage III sporulation protein AE [Clostridia bacterium]|nr:stage III sporulation protein AE [Clostridia bacterium]
MSARAWGILLLLLVLLPSGGLAQEAPEAAQAEESLEAQASIVLDQMELAQWQRMADALLESDSRLDVRETARRLLRGEAVLTGESVLDRILQLLIQSLRQSAGLMAQLIVPALLCGILSRMRASFERDTVAEVCHYTGFLVVALVAGRQFFAHLSDVRGVVEGMAQAMQALFPLLLTLLAAVGGTSSSAFFQPAIVAASGTMTALVNHVTLSFAVATALVTLLTHLSPQIGLGRLRSLLKTVANWSLGICFTVFIGVMAVQGMGAAAYDGVTLRTAKYAIDNFVPIVGGMFADTMDTLVACSLLVKNALGMTGLAVLLLSCIAPMIRVLACALVFRVCAAIAEPVADGCIVDLMEDFSGVLVMLFTVLMAVAAMFFLLIAQLLVVGNLTVMLR